MTQDFSDDLLNLSEFLGQKSETLELFIFLRTI